MAKVVRYTGKVSYVYEEKAEGLEHSLRYGRKSVGATSIIRNVMGPTLVYSI